MDDFLSQLFATALKLFGWAAEGTDERKQSLIFFGFLSVFCAVAACLLTGWASAVLFGLAGLGVIVLVLIGVGVLN